MSILNISFWVILSLGIVGIILALIYTKFIKPDSHKDKLGKLTSYPMLKLKRVIKKITKSNSNTFYNLLIDKNSAKRRNDRIYIPGIITTDEYIYLLASPITNDKNIIYKDKKWIWNNQDLKYDIWFRNIIDYLSSELDIDSNIFKLIIPTLKKTKNIKNVMLMKNMWQSNTFKNTSELSQVIQSKISSLNIVNAKGAR